MTTNGLDSERLDMFPRLCGLWVGDWCSLIVFIPRLEWVMLVQVVYFTQLFRGS